MKSIFTHLYGPFSLLFFAGDFNCQYWCFPSSCWIVDTVCDDGWSVMFAGSRWAAFQLFLKKHGLSRSDYVYIKQHLKEAGQKLVRLKKALFAVKNVQTIKHNYEILRLARRIYTITKRNRTGFMMHSGFILRVWILLLN